MKQYIKYFQIAMLIVIAFSAIFMISLNNHYMAEAKTTQEEEIKDTIVVDIKPLVEKPIKEEKETIPMIPLEPRISPLVKVTENSTRQNILLLGVQSDLADAIMIASYDPNTSSEVTIISVPRDLYHPLEGYSAQDGFYKINASYALANGDGGPSGVVRELEKVLNIPIHGYARVKYSGLMAIVDMVGGVDVNIEHLMDYEDPYSKPALKIYFEPGPTHLDGQKAFEYLRWRKNSDGSMDFGDLPRIKRQQDFVIKLVSKALQFDPLYCLKNGLSYVRTDVTIDQLMEYLPAISSFNTSSIKTSILPGQADYIDGISYYVLDEQAAEDMLMKLYGQ